MPQPMLPLPLQRWVDQFSIPLPAMPLQRTFFSRFVFAEGEGPSRFARFFSLALRPWMAVLVSAVLVGSCAPRCKVDPELGIVFDIDNDVSFIQATGENLQVDESSAGFNLLISHSSLTGEFIEMRIDVATQTLTFFRMQMFGLNIANSAVQGSTVFDFGTEEFECRNALSKNDAYKSGRVDLELDLGAGPNTRMLIDWTAALNP